MGPVGGEDNPGDAAVVARLRAGDEDAFRALVRRYHGSMTRVAASVVWSDPVAEEVVQETWIDVIRSLDRFEGRSSLRTWIFAILLNNARSRRAKEQRQQYLPLADETAPDGDGVGARAPVVDPSRFRSRGDPFSGYWAAPPARWWDAPEARLAHAETRAVIERGIRGLPPRQAQVVSLRDIAGWSAAEVCDTLGLSEGNQRVLLHRGRAQLRAVLESHLSQLAQT